jgi:hypothetical protein
MPKALKTNASVWTKVFRRIVLQVETNSEVRRVIGTEIRSWKGVLADKAPFEPQGARPVVRLTPQPRDVTWYSPDTQAGTLGVLVELAVPSLCIDDVSDLWDLICSACSPGSVDGQGNSFPLDLIACGAETGEIVFSNPAFDPKPDAQPEGWFFAIGRFELRILRLINP